MHVELYQNDSHRFLLRHFRETELSAGEVAFKIQMVNTFVEDWGLPLEKAAEFLGVDAEALRRCLLDFCQEMEDEVEKRHGYKIADAIASAVRDPIDL